MLGKLCTVFVLFSLIISAFCASERARLLVYKNVPEFEAVLNKNLTLTFNIFNAGAGSAFDVQLQDNDWSEGEFEILGDNSAKFESIAPGAKVTHSYSVVPKALGKLTTDRAIVTYKTSASDEEDYTRAYSNELPPIPVYTQGEYDKIHDKHYDEFAFTVLFFLLPIGLPYFVYHQAGQKIKAMASEFKKKAK